MIQIFQTGGTATQLPDWTPTTPIPPITNSGYSPYPPEEIDPNNPKNKKENKQKGTDLLPKEILKKLVTEGLPNDVDFTLNAFNALMNKYDSTLDINPAEMNRDFVQILSLTNKTLHNKEKWSNISKAMEQNNSFGETAMTSQGYGVAEMRDGSIKLVTPNEVAKNNGKFRLLSNSELMEYRARNPRMAFNASLFDTLDTNVSPNKFKDWLFGYLDKANKTTNEFSSDLQVEGTENIRSMMSLLSDPSVVGEIIGQTENGDQQYTMASNYYKVTRKLSSKAQQLQAMLNSAVAMMPRNYRNYLQLKAAETGKDPQQGSSEILLGILTGMEEIDNKTTFDPLKDPENKTGSSGGKDKNPPLVVSNPFIYTLKNKPEASVFTLGRRGPDEAPGNNVEMIAMAIPGKGFKTKENQNAPSLDWNTVKQKTVIGAIGNMDDAVVLVDDGEGHPKPQKLINFTDRTMFQDENYQILQLPVTADGQLDVTILKELENLIDAFQNGTTNQKEKGISSLSKRIQDELKKSGQITVALDKEIEDFVKLSNGYLYYDPAHPETLLFNPKKCGSFIKANVRIGLDTRSKLYRFFGYGDKSKLEKVNKYADVDKDFSIESFKKVTGFEDTSKINKIDTLFLTAVYIPTVPNMVVSSSYFFNEGRPYSEKLTEQDIAVSEIEREEQVVSRSVDTEGANASDL